MAVETLSGPMANVVGARQGLARDVKVMHGHYTFDTTVVEDGDIRKLCKIPGGIFVVGGYFITDNIDSNASETLDIDVGWAANGGGAVTYTDSQSAIVYTNAGSVADPDGFAKGGVLTADIIANLIADGFSFRPFTFAKPLYFSHETQVQAEVNAASATHGGGTLGVVIYYYAL